MAQFEQHFVQDLTQPIKVRHCGTIVFNADDESNVISVRLFNGSEPVAISGSVVGAVVCSDGSTVTLTGSYSGNTASITLTGDCFAILGQIGVGIQIVNGTQKTTVLKAIYNVEIFTTENVVDPGSRITLEVGDLIDDIETAVASIPADYSDLLAAIAPNYSGLTFPVKAGTFCWYNGALYQAQQGITTSEAWTAAHWDSAVLTTSLDEKLADVDDEIGDLKSIVTSQQSQINGKASTADLAAETARAEAEEARIEALFTEPTQEAVDNWLDEHPEATTTVQDGSLTLQKFTETLKLKTVNAETDIRLYGAIGDGETDCSEAFRDAIAYVVSNGGGVVKVPVGVFVVQQIVIPPLVTIKGENSAAGVQNYYGDYTGSFLSVVKQSSSATDALIKFEDNSYSNVLEGVMLVGNANFGDAVTINGTTRYRGRQIIRNVTIFDFAGYGIYISDNSDEVIINDTFVMRCGGPAGVYIGGQDVVIDTLAIGNCEKDGLHVTHGGNLRSINCDVFGNNENGIKIWDVLQCSFIKLTANGNRFNDVLIKREAFMPSRLYFVNSSFFNCGDGYSEVMADGAQQGYGLISAFINCIFGIANRSTHLAKYAFEANTQYVLSTSFVSCVFNENNFISFFNVDNVLSTYGCVCTDGSLVDSYARKLYQQNGVPLLTGGYYYTTAASYTVPNKVSFMAVGGTDGAAITLQKASTQEPGQRVTISNANSLNRTITVSTQSGDTLKGSNEIAGAYASGTFITDGTNTWQRI